MLEMAPCLWSGSMNLATVAAIDGVSGKLRVVIIGRTQVLT
jgi:hypothetical protein